MVERQLPKLHTGVRFSSPAPHTTPATAGVSSFSGRVLVASDPNVAQMLHRAVSNVGPSHTRLVEHRPKPHGQWSVFDNDNGQPRSPASLSGGEKFVASLALALGMVEMMGRQGGRIESLVLDEGFGALDRTNLDAAIEALASVAAKGRMVGVVTHLRAVAEQIENVPSVTREPAGSEAVWLAEDARADLATSSIESASGVLE